MLPLILFYCLKRIKIGSKKGIWKWQKSFTLRLKKVSWVALFHTTLVRFRITNILENFTLDDTFTALIGKLRVDPSPALAESVIAHPNFCIIRSVITATSETLSSMFVNYLNYPCL